MRQSDLERLVKWSDKWQMAYNANMCKVLHTGSNNNRAKYSINATNIPKINEEKDMGVTISSDLKPAKNYFEFFKTANKLIDFIRVQDRKSNSHTVQCPRASAP